MKNNKKLVITIFTLLLVLLAACSNSKDEVNEKQETQLTKTSSTQNAKDDFSNLNSAENTSIAGNTGTDTNDIVSDGKTKDTNEKVDISNNVPVKDEEIANITPSVSMKVEYQRKLNETKKEMDELEAEDPSTYAMKNVEGTRYDVWDELLNEVYGVLQEQLSTEEMEQLRKEQREWIKYRDYTAKEASLKYKDGTIENLEYTAVLVNLTEERCYELVEDYMM